MGCSVYVSCTNNNVKSSPFLSFASYRIPAGVEKIELNRHSICTHGECNSHKILSLKTSLALDLFRSAYRGNSSLNSYYSSFANSHPYSLSLVQSSRFTCSQKHVNSSKSPTFTFAAILWRDQIYIWLGTAPKLYLLSTSSTFLYFLLRRSIAMCLFCTIIDLIESLLAIFITEQS